MLLILGPLSSVSNLIIQRITPIEIILSWTPPFSLNITTTELDIIYCVEVFLIDVLNKNKSRLMSDCNVFANEYRISAAADVQNNDQRLSHFYEITVTPRNNLQGAMNGSSSTAFGPKPTGCYSLIIAFLLTVTVNNTNNTFMYIK